MKENERAIFCRLRQFSDAYAKKDLAGAIDVFSRTTNEVVVIGSTDDEIVIGLDAIREEFAREFTNWKMLRADLEGASLSISGDVAWVSLTCKVIKDCENAELKATGRLTAVLVKEMEHWFITHLHFSFPHKPCGNCGNFPNETLVQQPIEALRFNGTLAQDSY